ncbi:hypothetical protein BU15DRAFT_85702 [Melanogaster broomeanus]|nr:hypothetical protein BU15DRAFT_85702 [Melanogaster broomeanus]
MDAKLKSLKVADLKDILAKASASAPAKSNKQDLINRILANAAAVQIYEQLYPTTESKNTLPAAVPINSSSNDDLLAPPEDLDFEEFNVPLPVSSPKSSFLKQSPQITKLTPASPSKPPSKATPLVTPSATLSTEVPAVDDQALVDGELEKRRARAARFGIPLVEPKKPHQPPPKKAAPSTKAAPVPERKRAAPVEEVDPEEHERRRKRAERFRSSNGSGHQTRHHPKKRN